MIVMTEIAARMTIQIGQNEPEKLSRAAARWTQGSR